MSEITQVAVPVIPRQAAVEEQRPRSGMFRSIWARISGSDFVKALLIALAWQLAMTVVGMIVDYGLPRLHDPGYPPGYHFDPQWLAHTFRQDSGWFGMIMQSGYGTDYRAAAFYPLFPAAALLVKAIFFGAIPNILAGFIVNILSTWMIIAALLKIGKYFFTGRNSAWLTVGLLLSAPTAYYLHMFYSEALFLALGAWAYLFALRRQWVFMGLCLIPITASRITAVLFVGLCFLEFWRAKKWSLRGLISPHLVWFPLAGLGFLGYAYLLSKARNNPLGMFAAEKYWSYHKLNPNIADTIWRQVQHGWLALSGRIPFSSNVLGDQFLALGGLAMLLITSVYLLIALRGDGVPLGVFGLVSFVMLTLNSNTVSVCRYVLPCISVYIALAVFAQRSRVGKPIAYGIGFGSLLLQGVLYLIFICGGWIA